MARVRYIIGPRRCAFLILLVFSVTISTMAWTRAMITEEIAGGKLLVATPEMSDSRFAKTVVYLVKHGADGTMGLVINRPIARGPLKDLLEGFGIENDEAKGEVVIHYGGPLRADAGFVLHSDDVLLDDSIPVKDGIAMTADAKLIEAMARGKGPRQSLILFGYAGWAPGQLEGEIKAGAWHVVPADKDIVFGKDADKKWHEATDRRRIPL